MLIHKIQIAKRQIEAAADLFFGNGDPLAVVTLAGAAEEILGNIIRRRGDEAMLDHLVSRRQRDGRVGKVADLKCCCQLMVAPVTILITIIR